jgi:GH24 family phage-related lysozyme (muramidase)
MYTYSHPLPKQGFQVLWKWGGMPSAGPTDDTALLKELHDTTKPMGYADLKAKLLETLNRHSALFKAYEADVMKWVDSAKIPEEKSFWENRMTVLTVVKSEKNALASQVVTNVAEVKQKTEAAVVTAVPENAPKISKSGALKPTESTRNAITKTLFESYKGNITSKEDLAKAVSRAEAYTGSWEKVYENVTWEKPGAKPDVEKFQRALDQTIRMIQVLGGGNAGLDSLLIGNIWGYMKAIAGYSQRNPDKPLTIDLKNLETSAISPRNQTLLGAGMTVAVAAATAGIVIAWHEAQDVNADRFITELNKDKEGGFFRGLGKALNWLKDAAMGRRLSMTFGANEKEGNVTQYYEDIRNYTKAVMEGKYDSHPVLKSIYPAAKQLADNTGIDQNSDQFKKALVQAYILDEGFARKGVDLKGNIGLLFIGMGREELLSRNSATKSSEYNNIEKEVTKQNISLEELRWAGVTIEKKDGKWIHTIPASAQFRGDATPVAISISGKSAEGGKYTIATDKVQALHFSDSWAGYVVTMTDAADQPSDDATTATPTADRRQATKVENTREKGIENAALADKLYYIWHADPKVWSTLLRELGAMNYDAAKGELERIAKTTKFKSLANNLLKDFDNIASTGNTYTYGNAGTRSRVTPDQKGVDSMRTKGVLTAEARLAQGVGITSQTSEDAFRAEKYEPIQASAKYPGQEMTLAVMATPKTADGKTGAHRIDTMDGSFAIHSVTVDLDVAARGQVVDAMKSLVKNERKGISEQVKLLNGFLASNDRGSVTVDEYVAYLKTGKIEEFQSVKGLQLQEGKGTKVFEARAMIAGNVCMNRTYGIVYPAFELAGIAKKQDISIPATLDYSTPTNMSSVEARQSALGLSPAGVYARVQQNRVQSQQAEPPTAVTQPGATSAPPNAPVPTAVTQPGATSAPPNAPVPTAVTRPGVTATTNTTSSSTAAAPVAGPGSSGNAPIVWPTAPSIPWAAPASVAPASAPASVAPASAPASVAPASAPAVAPSIPWAAPASVAPASAPAVAPSIPWAAPASVAPASAPASVAPISTTAAVSTTNASSVGNGGKVLNTFRAGKQAVEELIPWKEK